VASLVAEEKDHEHAATSHNGTPTSNSNSIPPMDFRIKGLSCAACKLTPQSGLKPIITPCGGTICHDCARKSQEPHCQKCQDQKSTQEPQKTMLIHNFFTNFQPIDVSLPCLGLDLAIPFEGPLDAIAREMFDCPICFDLIFDPVTVNLWPQFLPIGTFQTI